MRIGLRGEGTKAMAAEVLEFEEILSERRQAQSADGMIFADITAAASETAGSLTFDVGNNSEVIPECFPDLATDVSGIASRETSAADAGERDGLSDGETAALSAHSGSRSEPEDRVALERRAWREGWEAGIERGREDYEESIRVERERFARQLQALFGSFEEMREDHLHRLERAAARLSLMCASRILRREVQADSLALTGAVRAALGQLAASADVRLVVPAEDEPMWRESMALIPGLKHRPQVIGEQAMKAGECRVESELGTADLSIAAQLKVLEEAMLQTQHAPSALEEAAVAPKLWMENRPEQADDPRESPSEGVVLT